MIGLTIKELNELLKTVLVDQKNIEVVYDHFNTPDHKPPFIVFTRSETATNKASDIVWSKYNNYIVDLIVEKIDVELEEQIETLFDNNFITYDKDTQFIQEERFYQVRYFI